MAIKQICIGWQTCGLYLLKVCDVPHAEGVKTNTDQTLLFRQFRDAWSTQPQDYTGQGTRNPTTSANATMAKREPAATGGVKAFFTSLRRQFGITAPCSAQLRPGQVHLPDREIIRIGGDSGIGKVRVRSGLVWLTSTPSGGDVILREGQEYDLTQSWPFLVEALTESEVDLLP